MPPSKLSSASTMLLAVLLTTCVSAGTISRRSAPPPPEKSALMARYVVNEADWASIATISVREDARDYPFVNLVSLSDGIKGNGTGVPYIYMTPLDFTGKDLLKDQRVSMMMTLAQSSWCNDKGYDPEDPHCARLLFTGRIEKILKDHPDYAKAKEAFFPRHEWLSFMPIDHEFYLARLNIETVVVLAQFGGAARVSVDDYFAASQTEVDGLAKIHKLKNKIRLA